MHPPDSEFVGRQSELQALEDALRQAHLGRGSVWLVQGEPGIGKSRLCERVSAIAEEMGFASVWGRAWEAGGAPAYWPWLQAFRQLLREHREAESAFAIHAKHLSTVMPEVVERWTDTAPLPSLEPEQARFQLLDAMTGTLARAADTVPLLVVLEDLHAADSSSVALLEFVSKLVQRSRILVLGTLRDADAMWSAVAPALLRVQRQARVLTLPRLSKDEVRSFLSSVLENAGRGFVLDAVYRITEGHPLFVVETARLMAARGGALSGNLGIPPTVKVAIRERLAKLSPETLAMLRAASAFGRDVPHGPLSALLESPLGLLEPRLLEATERSVLIDAGPTTSRFSHVLFQEVLLSDVDPTERQRLHLTIGRILERWGERRPPSSVLAHHYLRAGPAGSAAGIDAAVAAASEASKQLAFDDAVDWHRAALDALDEQGDSDPIRRCRLLLGLAAARLAAGEVAASEQTARFAGEVAREAGSPELFAEAALARAATFMIAEVDPDRVAYLQAALDGLPPGDTGLRARLMARLAAAMQPADDPSGPIELARRAVQMARRLGNETTLLATVRSAGSALMDFAHPSERRELNEEHVRLADALHEPVEALRGTMRLVFDLVQVGDFVRAQSAVEAAARIGDRLQHPHYRWRPVLLQAMLAQATGDFRAWEERIDEARRLVKACNDPNGPRTLVLHELEVLVQRGRYEAAHALLPEIEAFCRGSIVWDDISASLALALKLRTNRAGEVSGHSIDTSMRRTARLGDSALLRDAAWVCVALGDREHGAMLYEGFVDAPFAFMHGGMFEVIIKGPIGLTLGALARLLGRAEDAKRHFLDALDVATRAGTEPFAAWAELELSVSLIAERRFEEAKERLDRAATVAERLDLPDLLARVSAARETVSGGSAAVSASTPPVRLPTAGRPRPESGFSLAREGEMWRMTCGDTTFLVKDTRGMHMLHRLIAEPGREFHALDLVSWGARGQDLGDAGEILDVRARAEYERRIADLRAELEEAEAFGDLGRSARAREELDFLAGELGRAVGMGGRERRAGSNTERARVNAQRRLRDAIRRIGEHHRDLAKHLEWAVKTGTFCSYSPE